MPGLFSQRKGIKSIKKEIQKDAVDEDLRNGLWNCLYQIYLTKFPTSSPISTYAIVKDFAYNYWQNYFKLPIDTIPPYWNSFINLIKDNILKKEWYEVYDHIEFIVTNFKMQNEVHDEFRNCCNAILEKEFSAYRLVGNVITENTSSEEIGEIEEALQSPVEVLKTHLSSALEKLSDRQSPDYRNSIKESISAVEGICKLITKNPNTTLGVALDEIEAKGTIQLHPDMKDAFKKIYHYTSDSGGIRHALMDVSSGPDFDDAKFMLVSCSAIVNYLTSKANKSGISLS